MPKKILLIRLGSLGDIILTSATVVNLKINFPDCHLTYLCKEKFRPVVELIPGVDKIVTLPNTISTTQYFRLLLDLDEENFDTIIDLHGNLRSWAARKMVTADRVAVYPKRRLDRLVAVKGKIIPKAWPHTIDLYNDAIEQIGGRVFCRRPQLQVGNPQNHQRVEEFVSRNRRYAVIAPGAAHPNKQWPIERFEQVAADLNRKHGFSIVWAITGEDARENAVREHTDQQSILELVDEPIPGLAQIIRGASLTISNDSGIAHLSSAVATPTLAIFGPTHPALGFAPAGMYDRVLEVDEPCRPCSLHGKKPCYREERFCFDRITGDMVVDAAVKLAERGNRTEKAVLVDRDGTIIKDKNFMSDAGEIEFENGAVQALRRLADDGYRLVMISNQSGVARGYFDIDSVERVNARLLEMLTAEHVEVDAVYYCPHHPRGTVNEFSFPCDCRKPSPGMAEEAAYQLGIDLRKSFVIGDKADDVNLGKVIGARAIMVRTGYGTKQQDTLQESAFYSDVVIADDLPAAAEHILAESDKC